MKLIFSILFSFYLFTGRSLGRDIVVIEHIQNSETAKIVKNILINKFQLPEILIQTSSQNDACTVHSDAILHLCILKNGELEIKKINNYILKSAFNIFFDQNEKSLTRSN